MQTRFLNTSSAKMGKEVARIEKSAKRMLAHEVETLLNFGDFNWTNPLNLPTPIEVYSDVDRSETLKVTSLYLDNAWKVVICYDGGDTFLSDLPIQSLIDFGECLSEMASEKIFVPKGR